MATEKSKIKLSKVQMIAPHVTVLSQYNLDSDDSWDLAEMASEFDGLLDKIKKIVDGLQVTYDKNIAAAVKKQKVNEIKNEDERRNAHIKISNEAAVKRNIEYNKLMDKEIEVTHPMVEMDYFKENNMVISAATISALKFMLVPPTRGK